ncbi:hypothetical protein KPH14_008996 [Odynerus spinipes]|uniref:Uncharacterized protein n=1 Tax=Odynerus spinipes TaxID=1348599 RepID=A0AAD9VR32_9HYME|nr:hypothetical protein KPH14_008996 [Odynerus spinipes]
MGLVEREANMQDLGVPRPGRSRDLFGVQLEVTSLLLEAERRKLAVLQRELQVALAEGGSVKVKEKQRQELLHAISKIQGQHEQLDKEYRIHAAGVLLCNSRGSGKIHAIRENFTSILTPSNGLADFEKNAELKEEIQQTQGFVIGSLNVEKATDKSVSRLAS